MNTLKLTGEIEWTQNLFVPDEYRGSSAYKINLVLDKNGLEVFKASGLSNKLREHESGAPWVSLRCPTERNFAGKIVHYGPPVVTINGEPYDVDKHGLIGNGSGAVVEMEVYKFGKDRAETGGRLRGVDVTELIVYEIDDEPPVKSGTSEEVAKAW